MISCSLPFMPEYITSKKDIQHCLDRLFTLRQRQMEVEPKGRYCEEEHSCEGSLDTVYSIFNTYLTLCNIPSSLQSAKRWHRHGSKLFKYNLIYKHPNQDTHTHTHTHTNTHTGKETSLWLSALTHWDSRLLQLMYLPGVSCCRGDLGKQTKKLVRNPHKVERIVAS